MMKANGIHQTQPALSETPSSSCRRKRKNKTSPTSSKKRKMSQFGDNSITAADDDDDEGLGNIKDEKLGKSDGQVTHPVPKEEANTGGGRNVGTQYPWLHHPSSQVDHFQHAASQTSSESKVGEDSTSSDSVHSNPSTPTDNRGAQGGSML